MAGAESRNSIVLNSWKEIARYLGRGVRTVQRWETEAGLPVHRPRGYARSAVLAMSDEIDLWLRSERIPQQTVPSHEVRRRHEPMARAREAMQRSAALRERCVVLCSENRRALDAFLANMQKLRESLEVSRTRLPRKQRLS